MRFSVSKFLAVTFAGALLIAPSLALAAYNDVTLTTNTVISVGGYSLDVSGSSAAIQSITVNAGNFSITLASGSSIVISSPSLQQLSSDVTSDVVSNTCTGSASSISLAYSGAGTVTNTITPSATLCTTAASSGGGGGGGGGGGPIAGSLGSAPLVNTNAIPPAVEVATTSAVMSPSTPAMAAEFANDSQDNSDPQASLTFTRNLTLGMRGDDVKELQIYLNAHGFPIALSGPGSPGNETTYFGHATQVALAKFQAVNEITPAKGYFGQKTKLLVSLMSEVQELLAEISTLTAAEATSSSATSAVQ